MAGDPERANEMLVISIKYNAFDYTKSIITYTIQSTEENDFESTKALFMDDDVQKRLKSSIELALVNQKHQFAKLF